MVGTRERRATDKVIGEVLASRYRVESLLGEGAMGAVYKAKHVKVGRSFAVKILHPKLLEDGKVAQRFEREAELAGRLRHPNVIGVVDVGETSDGLRYMVMDFAEGPDLAKLLGEAPLSPQRVIHLTKQLLEGLYHAHEAGMIHRDFKPENVIVERNTHGSEIPKIVDFGIAILRESGDSSSGEGRLTTNGLVLGTPHYMAPEQAVADPIDHRIDLFALGIVVYEMLCGKLPFDGTGSEVARANLLLDPPPISQRVPHLEVDPLLEAFSRKLMEKKRDHRPATAKAARELLELIETDREHAARVLGVPVASVRVATMTQPSAPQRRHDPDNADTFPPPFAAGTSHDTTPQAPMHLGPQARISTSPIARTDMVEPLGRPKRRGLMFAGIAGAFGAAIVAVVLMSGSDKSARRTVEPSPPAPTVVLTQAPVEAQPVEKPAPPVVEPPAPIVSKKDPPRIPVAQPKKDPKLVAVTPSGPPDVKQRPNNDPPPVTKADPPATKIDADSVSRLYKQLGVELPKLGDAGRELFEQWRLIRIQDAMKDPKVLEATAKKLAALQSQAAKLKK